MSLKDNFNKEEELKENIIIGSRKRKLTQK